MSGVLLHHFLPFFLETGSLIDLGAHHLTRLMHRELPDFLPSLPTGVPGMCSHP